MSGYIIYTTVGTSALDRNKLEPMRLWDSYQRIRIELTNSTIQRRQSWIIGEKLPSRVNQFIDEYIDVLKRLDIQKEMNKPLNSVSLFSGELTSLYLMFKNSENYDDLQDLNLKKDILSFLLSDSAEGVLCGLIHERYICQGTFLDTRDIHSTLSIIDGLKTDNLAAFLKDGLTKFSNILNDNMGDGTRLALLNATGGFKSLVPYSTFFCLAYSIPMFFAFEELPRLIRVKPPVITSNEERERFRHFIQQVSDNTKILKQSPGPL